MTIDIFAYPASNKAFSNQNAQLKFISKFSKISGKEEKKLKEYLVRLNCILLSSLDSNNNCLQPIGYVLVILVQDVFGFIEITFRCKENIVKHRDNYVK